MQMSNQVEKNDFLINLLALQQDGTRAISAPTNWLVHEPLLDIHTEVDNIVKGLADSILVGENQNIVARWHFFIGSPGNGKSVAMGKLCRYLLEKRGCQVKDEQECFIQDLDVEDLPYALSVYERDNRFISALIVQDASVVRNPFSPYVDPAKELISILEHAWSRGISLIICTNRGILEKAHRDNHMNSEVNTQPWFKVLSSIVQSNHFIYGELPREWEFEDNKIVFSKVKISYSHLDNRSLLIGKDIFDQLIQKAVSTNNWDVCNTCSSKELCPFKTNRDWLNNPDGRKNFLCILRKAEAYSGQIIVFREAVAIISLILAGCPRDYKTDHPCMWVTEKIRNDDILSLMDRRIYMILFSSFTPFGLESTPCLARKQVEAFGILKEVLPKDKRVLKMCLEKIIKGDSPSIDVGVTRLLGEKGILRQINPCLDLLPPDFYDSWDGEYNLVSNHSNSLVSLLERRCAEMWAFFEQALELLPRHNVSEVHWALRRWSSNYFMHLGALLEGRTAWQNELSQYISLLEIVVKQPSSRTFDEKRCLHKLNKSLGLLLDMSEYSHETGLLQLSEAVALSGDWVSTNLKPRISANGQLGNLSLLLEFVGGEKTTLGAPMFLWLTRRAHSGLDSRCFPPELLAGVADARIRASAKGKYAFENNDVQLIITGVKKGQHFRMLRIDGDVEVQYEQDSV